MAVFGHPNSWPNRVSAAPQHLYLLAEKVVTARGTVEVRVEIEPPDSGEARWCLEQYFRELLQRFEAGYDPTASRPIDAAQLTPPAGVFVIGRRDGRPVGCGALRMLSDGVAEVRRMWILGEARGTGVGRRILAALEAQARDMGVNTLRLETNRALKEAQALYRRCGFVEVAPFNDELYAHHWFEKTLDGT
jgi:GNAT superfamily N-acetyltransferase